MNSRRVASWMALALVSSCALPALEVDPDLDEDGGEGGGGPDQGGGPDGGTAGSRGGTTGGGGTDTGGKGGTTTGGAGGSCAAGLTSCSGTCVNTSSDDANCSRCGNACEISARCIGSTCTCQVAVGASEYLFIDDLEDNDGVVGNEREPPIRIGYWYVFNDGYVSNDGATRCTQVPPADSTGVIPFVPNCGNANCSMLLPTPNGTQGAAHMAGGDCSTWGAGMGFQFNSCQSQEFAFDGSAYRGIRFWYRSTTPLRVLVGTIENIPITDGGTCDADAEECYNNHGRDLPASTGTTQTVEFSTLSQDYGPLRTFNQAHLADVQFQVDPTQQPYDVWIDDIYFIP
jgi:hypothetical protein